MTDCHLNGVGTCDNCSTDCDYFGTEIFDPERGLNGFQGYVYDFLRKRLNLKSVDVVRIQTDYAFMWSYDKDVDLYCDKFLSITIEIKKNAFVLGNLKRPEFDEGFPDSYLGFLNVGKGQYTTHYNIWRENNGRIKR